MAFVLYKDPTFLWPFSIELADDSGDFVPFKFKVRFRRMSQDYTKDVLAKLSDGVELDYKAIVTEIIAGWEDIEDENGGAVKFTAANLEALLKIPTMSPELFSCWLNATAKVKEKNLQEPLSTGQPAA